jgi:hypothetical protein
MPGKVSGGWWSRNFWVIVLFPCLAAVLLAVVSVFKGWLHQWVGFDPEGNRLEGDSGRVIEPKKPLPAPKPRSVVSAAESYRHIVDDLRRRDPEARPRLRYLTLLHRHNEPTCADADLEQERRAVRDLAGLLWRGRAGTGKFIDPDQLLFRIDLEELDWTAATDWHQVVSHYGYGLGGGGDEPLAKLRQQVEQLTEDTIPVVRADWFVVAVTRPPLAGPNGLVRTPLNELPESIRTMSRQYAAQTLDLAACRRELGLNDDKTLADLIRRQENLQQEFELAPLIRGERIRREWWESDRNFFSPYQELARQLKIGKPVRVQ